MFKRIKTFIKREFPEEENIIYIVFGIWGLFLISSLILSSSFEAKYEWLGKINSGTWGDSFGGINSLISMITFFLVYKTFGLQKNELEKTTNTLKLQENAIKEQKFQDTFTLLLKTAQEHINLLNISAEEIKNDKNINSHHIKIINDIEPKFHFGLRGSMVVRYLLDGDGQDKILDYITRGTLGNFKKYINTLGMLEECINNADTVINKDFFIKLAKAQINISEIELYKKLKVSAKQGEFIELTIFNQY